MGEATRATQPAAKRRMQTSSSGELSTQLISAAAGASRREQQHGAYSSSGGIEAAPQLPTSGSIDSLAMGFRAQASINNSGSDEDSGFEDKSESISSVYSRLMTDYRVNICLYNKEHETHYRPKVSAPSSSSSSHRKSPSPSASGVRMLALSGVAHNNASTPPHSPALLHAPPATAHRTGALRSVSMDNLEMSDAVSVSSHAAAAATTHPSKPNTMWDIAQKRNLEETPKLSIGEIIGLKEVKGQLEMMLVPYIDSRKKLLFSVGQQSQPDRTLFVRSEKGSGIHTLVNAVCKKSGVNLIRVSYGAENEWDNKLFTKLLDFALAIQPVVVFFDRCDAWFAKDGEGWRHRGDKFILALEGNASIANGRADVLFVVSACEYLVSMHPRFVQWIKPYRSVQHKPFDQVEAQQFLYQTLNFHINEIQNTIQTHHNLCMSEYGGLVDAARGEMEQLNRVIKMCDEKRLQTKELAAKICPNFKSWTPAMISMVVSRAIDIARTRELSRQEPSTHYDIVNLVPTAMDVVTVINSIMRTEPGIIEWKSS